MRKYNYLQALGLSFYSRDLYRDIAQNWGAATIFYLLMLVSLCSIFQVAAMQHEVNQNMTETGNLDLDKMALQFPVITLHKDGTIQTPENRPYLIYSPDGKKLFLVIDTSGHYTTLENQPFDGLITKTEYMIRKKNGDIQITHVPTGINYEAHPDQIKEVIKTWAKRLWIILLPMIILPIFFWRLILTGIYAVIGKIFSKIIGHPLSYYTIFGLAIVALTPSMILNIALKLINFSFPYETLFFFLVGIFYLFFAVRVNKKEEQVN